MNRQEVKDYQELFKNYSILVVDDEEDTIRYMRPMLEKFFKDVYCGKNGLEGVELYKKYNPDIVLADVTMPKLDGIDMAKRLIKINSELKIIFLTGHSESRYADLYDDFGALDILKPINKNVLFTKIKEALLPNTSSS
jgi:YesN/AraC family two-component response regulator